MIRKRPTALFAELGKVEWFLSQTLQSSAVRFVHSCAGHSEATEDKMSFRRGFL